MNIEQKKILAQVYMGKMIESRHPALTNETFKGLAVDACDAVDAIEAECNNRWKASSSKSLGSSSKK